ncbi:MAG: D-aminoacyl-tRNA deacylase [Cytophagales bacterium]|nr:D-aminoacyl-tRNA deacylase [Cytophagales bacterium]
MTAVLQRISYCKVHVEGNEISRTGVGLLLLLGIAADDTHDDTLWLLSKVLNMRIFNDDIGKMNLSLKDVGGELMIVSQFTLLANTKQGNRPSFALAAKPDIAHNIYQSFVNEAIAQWPDKVKTGIFGADMQVSLINDGPVTILIDTKNKK